MSNGKKKQLPVWQICLEGLAAALALYLAGTMAVTGLVLGEILPEESAFWGLAAAAAGAGGLGGLITGKRTPWRPIWGALVSAALLSGVLLLAGLTGPEIDLTGEGGGLLVSILAGAVAAAVLGQRKRKHKYGTRQKYGL